MANEKGTMAWVIPALLTVIVIFAVLMMKLIPGASTPSPASPPTVVKMKIPSMPKAEPQKADGLQQLPEVEERVETMSVQPHNDSTAAEPNVEAMAALSSPADATSPPQAETEVAPGQESSADRGPLVQKATPEVAEDVHPGATSESTVDLVETEVTAVVAAKAPETPVAQDRLEPAGAATAAENETLYTVQVGAFHTKAYASSMMEELNGLGYPAYIFKVMDKKQLPLYLVCFGHFQTLAEAGDTIAAFKAKEKMPAVLARPESW